MKNSILLILFLLDFLKKFNLLNRVVIVSDLVNVDELDNDEDEHDWAHSALSFHVLFHLSSGLIVDNFHENGHESLALTFAQEVEEVECEEGGNRLVEDSVHPLSFFCVDGAHVHLADAEDNEGKCESDIANVLEDVI